MALTAALTQVNQANFGNPTTFTLAVSNSGTDAVNVTGIAPWARARRGPHAPVNIMTPQVFPGVSVPQVGGSQFNVQVPGSGTVYFSFGACFYGPGIKGGPTQPQDVFMVGCDLNASDGTSFSAGSLMVALNSPSFGPGSQPPNPTVLTGQLNYSSPANSGLGL